MVIYMKPRPPSQATDDSKTRISPQKIKQKEKQKHRKHVKNHFHGSNQTSRTTEDPRKKYNQL